MMWYRYASYICDNVRERGSTKILGSGVHRDMPEFAVSEEKNRWLQSKMVELGVREEDLEESFVRSSGNGGQHVNKTSSCVQLKHKPTGITATCMRERSQSVNRFLARRKLLERIEAASGVITPAMKRIEKLHKQKDRRRRRSSVKPPPNGA